MPIIQIPPVPPSDPPQPPVRRIIEIRVPTGTILKLAGAALLLWMLIRLWPELLLLFASLLIAVTLAPLVSRLEGWRLPRWVAVLLVAAVGLGGFLGLAAIAIPPLVMQLERLSSDLPAIHQNVVAQLPHSTFLRAAVDQAFELPSSPEVRDQIKPLEVGQTALTTMISMILLVVLSLYLLLDGRRLYAWLLAFAPRSHRGKIAETAHGVMAMIQAFVRGQLVISAMFATFVAISLSLLGVRAVLPLALLAFVCDIIPVVGIIIATAPAVLLALSDSPLKALSVFGLLMGYHIFEAYVLVPRVYGAAMRLSTLTVLLAIIVGGSLQGIIGAIMVLPLVAAYPIVERIWLSKFLSEEVVRDHQALDRDERDGQRRAVENVIQGKRHTLPTKEPKPEVKTGSAL